MRGHGDSDWIESGDYRVQSFADDVAALLPQWSKQAILVGASLGALASLLVAGSGHPQVRAVVLFDCAPKLNPELSKEFLAWLWHESDNGFASPQAALAYLNSQFPASEWSLASIQRALCQTDGGRWRWHWDRRIVALALPFLERCAGHGRTT
jgi:peroxiredoxin